MRFVSYAAICACALLMSSCDWKAGQANNAQGNISNESREPAPANNMAMLASPLSKDRALAVMHERHEGMEAMGKASKEIGRQLKSGSPDLGAIRASARPITDFAPKVSKLFPRGTGPDVGKTGAKPEIWQTPEDFAAKARDFQGAARAFGATLRGNDVNAIGASFGNLGKTCKACHDKYRAEMKH